MIAKPPLLLALMMAGCAAPGGTAPPPPVADAGECDAAPVQDLIGRPATAALGLDARDRSGARTLRWIQPGMAVTMDYRQDRLNIDVDEKNVVTRLACG
ncbi:MULTISPECIES: I78 family peptidase inhibitor [unclassified Sphingomonas]|jgi:hypothetical protein|uniref:I78 family peptidase inhibitor n=1 Tax=unclassified Sphingomonas TaxID=196159 RepID=UPI0008298D8A|nr:MULTISPECIES: I78 family peptidase inhibitor [unclassified Sphingomonas]